MFSVGVGAGVPARRQLGALIGVGAGVPTRRQLGALAQCITIHVIKCPQRN